MDFTMNVDKFTYIRKQYETVIEDLDKYILDYYKILDELTPEWEGNAKEAYLKKAFYWVNQCSELKTDIENFNKILNENIPSMGALLDRGKALKVV